ncbi:MAG TPA: serine hydrolase, partial [Gemmatimonadales bacterium]|nr:serine hydrolase [Gemmatimonadales bacterium]
MSPLTLPLLLLAVQASDSGSLRSRVAARIAQAPARAVGVYYRDLTTGDSLTVGSAVRFHAASTMKIPVMIQLFRDRDAGLLSLDDSITVTNTFRSIVDSSPYQLDVTDDSDSTLYKRLGQRASLRELIELMETVSSNLATNVLIARVGAGRAN